MSGTAAVLAAGGVYWWRVMPPQYGGAKLMVTQAHQAAVNGEIVLVDIRTPREWAQTGVPEGAHAIDMRRDDFLAALSQVAGADKGRPIAVICARGVRSAWLSRALSDAGYTNIVDVPEGMLGSGAGPGWLKTGLPVVSVAGG